MNYELGSRKKISITRSGGRIKTPAFVRGVSLIEVVVATAILFVAVVGLLTAYNVFTKVSLRTLGTVQASYLLEEGFEAVSTLRDFGWTSNIANLTPGTSYYLNWSGGRWITTTTATTTDGTYTRYIKFANVSRDANSNIASSGTVDSGTKKFTITVSWLNGATTTSRSASGYIMNLFSN